MGLLGTGEWCCLRVCLGTAVIGILLSYTLDFAGRGWNFLFRLTSRLQFAKLQLDLAQYAAVRRTAHFVEVPLMIYPAFRGRESGAEQVHT